MADTQRTRAALQLLLADNVTGDISPQDLRDFLVTVMEVEFANPGDFWAQPSAGGTITDKTCRGAKIYSQLMLSEASFGRICYMTASGWAPADVANSAKNADLAVVCDSYVAAESQATLLRWGVVYDSALSARFSGNIGRLLYLQSALAGSLSVTIGTSVKVVGRVMRSAWSDVTSGHWFFDPDWSVTGS